MKKSKQKKCKDQLKKDFRDGINMEEEKLEEKESSDYDTCKEEIEQDMTTSPEQKPPRDEVMEEIEVELEKKAQPEEKSKEKEYYDRMMRIAADFDNYKKRMMKEKTEYTKYSNERLIKEFLPIVDNLERAMESAKTASESSGILQGVELILNQMRSMLKKEGVEAVESKGKDFDPLIHEAICQMPTKDYPPNTVIEEHQKAYFLNNKLIRPAKVVVAKEFTDIGNADPAGKDGSEEKPQDDTEN